MFNSFYSFFFSQHCRNLKNTRPIFSTDEHDPVDEHQISRLQPGCGCQFFKCMFYVSNLPRIQQRKTSYQLNKKLLFIFVPFWKKNGSVNLRRSHIKKTGLLPEIS